MGIADKVLHSMNFNHEYAPADIAVIVHIPEKDAGAYLHMLSKAGVVECINNDRFRKNRKYKTKQRNFAF